jgi:hypothetical protein
MILLPINTDNVVQAFARIELLNRWAGSYADGERFEPGGDYHLNAQHVLKKIDDGTLHLLFISYKIRDPHYHGNLFLWSDKFTEEELYGEFEDEDYTIVKTFKDIEDSHEGYLVLVEQLKEFVNIPDDYIKKYHYMVDEMSPSKIGNCTGKCGRYFASRTSHTCTRCERIQTRKREEFDRLEKVIHTCDFPNCAHDPMPFSSFKYHKHSDVDVKCIYCESIFTCTLLATSKDTNLYSKHCIDVHGTDKHLKCDLCDYKTNEKQTLKQHSKIHNKKNIKCLDCDLENFQSDEALKKHSDQVHGHVNIFQCACRKRFPKSGNLKRHKNKCKV